MEDMDEAERIEKSMAENNCKDDFLSPNIPAPRHFILPVIAAIVAAPFIYIALRALLHYLK